MSQVLVGHSATQADPTCESFCEPGRLKNRDLPSLKIVAALDRRGAKSGRARGTSDSKNLKARLPKAFFSLLPVKRVVSNFDGIEEKFLAPVRCPTS